jgi:glycerophosphoryl diester phosphodiesterase
VAAVVAALIVTVSSIVGSSPAQASAYTSCVYAAHRGYHAHATENSLNAMKAAIRRHANYLEMDVQATSDGRFFLMHDETVTRTTNGRGRIRDKTARQVNRLRLNDGEHVPSLSRVLDMAKPTRAQVMLEMKWIPQSLMPTLESRIEDFGTSRVVLHSFSGDAVHEFRGLYPDTDIRTALDTAQLISVDEAVGYGGVLPDYRITTSTWLSDLKAAGVPVYVWTVDRSLTWSRFVGQADAVITNRAATFDTYRRRHC